MKISFVIQDLFSQGAQYATAMMVRGFVSKGYDVDLIVSKVHADLLAEGRKPFDTPDSVHWVCLKDRKARRNILELRRYLARTDSTAVVAMCSTYVEALAIASLGLKRRPQLVAVEHGITFALREDWSEKPSACLFLRRGLMQLLVDRQFDRWLAVSDRIRLELSRVFKIDGNRIATVYNPVVGDNFSVVSLPPPVHQWLKAKTCPTIITGGSYTNDKNHLLLLEAVRRVVLKMPMRLVLFGEGPLRSQYEDFVRMHHLENVVSLAGFSNQLMAEMAACDGYVCSSQIESFAIAPVQAMACRVPVVCCDCPCGPREILANGRYGRLVKTQDVEDLTAAMTELVQGRVPVAPVAAWKRFSVEAVTENYERAMGL